MGDLFNQIMGIKSFPLGDLFKQGVDFKKLVIVHDPAEKGHGE